MDALRLPAGRRRRQEAVGRREAPRRAVPRCSCRSRTCLLLDEPTNHLDAESVAWLEQFLKEFPGTVVAITHDRYFLDNVAGWILELDRGAGIPWKGNYSSWLEQKQKRLADEEKQESARQRQLARELEWVQGVAQGAPGQVARRACSATKSCWRRTGEKKADDIEIQIPHGPRLGDDVVIAEHLKKGFGDNAAHRRSELPPAQGRHRRRHRPERRRQDDAVPHDRRRRRSPTAATLKVGTTVKLAYVDQSREAIAADKTRLAADLARRRVPRVRQAEDQHARLHLVVRLPRLRSAEARQGAVGRRAQPPAPGDDAQDRRQPAPARRADQRSRRRHAARARGGALPVRRLRGGHLATIAGSSIASPRTSWRSRATPRSSGSRATTKPTRPTRSAGSAPTPISRTAFATRSSRTNAEGSHRAGRSPRARSTIRLCF